MRGMCKWHSFNVILLAALSLEVLKVESFPCQITLCATARSSLTISGSLQQLKCVRLMLVKGKNLVQTC